MPVKKVKTPISKGKVANRASKQIKSDRTLNSKVSNLNSIQSQKSLEISKNNLKEKGMKFWNKFKQPKIFVQVILIILLILAAIFGQRLLFVAYVNGQPITRMAYYNELEQKDGAQVLQNLVVETLINQEAAKKGIVVTNTDVQNA